MSSPVCGFAVTKTYEGQKDFDQTYKSIELKKKLVPLGPADENGEVPYTEEIIEHIVETPIKDVISAQNDSCGLEAYLKPYRMAGQEPPMVEVGDRVQDFTPFDSSEDLRVSGMVDSLFSRLPNDLQEKYGCPEKLLREISDNALRDYCEKYVESLIKKSEENVEEEK